LTPVFKLFNIKYEIENIGYKMSKDKNTSKFKRLYGRTLQDMSDRYGFNVIYLWRLHKAGELYKFIIEHEKMERILT
jgi:hypothetical protein